MKLLGRITFTRYNRTVFIWAHLKWISRTSSAYEKGVFSSNTFNALELIVNDIKDLHRVYFE